MRSAPRRRPWPPAGAVLTLLAGVAVACAPGAARAWDEFGRPPPAIVAAGDTIVEPFFAFVLGRAEADSLGAWDASDLAAFAAARGRPSRLPLQRLVALERRRPTPGSEGRHAGARVLAEWVITFDAPLDFPLPYSILGYHPGSLRLSRSLRLAELAPVDLTVGWNAKKQQERRPLAAVRVFAFEQGFLLLDADGLVDRLLGEMLDDSWTVGFVVARDGRARLGLGLMLGRDGRSIYGEFDFAGDRIEAHGRPLAGALASAARRWLDPADGLLPAPWVED